MLTLRFHSISELILGPARAFCIDAQAIRQHPHDEIVSRRANDHWQLLDEYGSEARATSFECHDRSLLQLEDRQGRVSPRYGPFSVLDFRDDCLFADGVAFAVLLSKSLHWEHCSSGVRWPILNLLAARGVSTRHDIPEPA